MVKNTKIENEAAKAGKRLQEIAEIKFEDLTDDDVLQFLEERKRLKEIKREYERLQKEEREHLRREQDRLRKEEEGRKLLEKQRAEQHETLKKQKRELTGEINKLNESISADKVDDELLAIIAKRKKFEEELKNIEADLVSEFPIEVSQIKRVEMSEENVSADNFDNKKSPDVAISLTSFRKSLKDEFGQEGIAGDFPEGGELHRYLTQLKNNTGSLGTLLQEMSADAKKNKAFMLQVAKIDPAYAMHYADEELKNDEDFNIRVASLKNPRNSGNALAEMFPKGRTSRVVLAAVKQDYRNIKFVQPNMEHYDEMMHIAKKATMEKLKDLKNATDMLLLIPRPLQRDTQFMAEAKKVMPDKTTK